MYKIHKASILKTITLRGNYLTKKIFKKNSKQTLIFLRSPKHFNIGKHKVSSFTNYKKYTYLINYKIPTFLWLKSPSFAFNIFHMFHKINFLYIVNSIKISSSVKIKWN